ncbi:MarR family transcriptional regulator [Neisseriaceae bacterium ESL0693]|nr:MarR family transcriptional regulator [Neisseriaceae bacterium ESL0693]
MGFALPCAELESTLRVLAEKLPSTNIDEIVLSRLVRLLYTNLNGQLNECLHEHKLSESLWHALLAIYSRPEHEILPSELSDILNLTRTSATRLSDDLVQNGWATRDTHPLDRRKITLKLTKTGEEIIQQISPETNAVRNKVWSVLTKEERQQFREMVLKLLATV